jgi:hypothetical protein
MDPEIFSSVASKCQNKIQDHNKNLDKIKVFETCERIITEPGDPKSNWFHGSGTAILL